MLFSILLSLTVLPYTIGWIFQAEGMPPARILDLAQKRYERFTSTPMEGRNVVITGAAGGIGQELCKVMYRLGASVIALDCNDCGLREMSERYPGLVAMQVDHSNLTSVADVAMQLRETVNEIDVLVNAAGITYHQGAAGISVQGVDLAFTVNYLSHFLLVQELAPCIRARGRIIQLTSTYHWKVDGKEITPAPNGKAPIASLVRNQSPRHVDRSYGNTKLAQIWHSQELSRRLGLHAVNVCPTWVGTNIGGEENRQILLQLAFDPSGAGLTSTLNSIRRVDEELGNEVLRGEKLVANSNIIDMIWPLKLLMISNFVARRDGWRDAIVDFVGVILLLGQHITHTEMIIQEGSPETTDKAKSMTALYDWSFQKVLPYLSESTFLLTGANNDQTSARIA